MPLDSLTRSPHITERRYPTPPPSSNPSWIYPHSENPVTVYEMTARGTITQSKGYYDGQGGTWRKVNGQAITILGWS